MSFDPQTFCAELALGFVRTDNIPIRAYEALEAGFNTPGVLRLVVLEGESFSEIDAALPKMLEDFGCVALSKVDAAIYLASTRARAILANDADPLDALGYFYRLLVAADYPDQLSELGWLGDDLDLLVSSDPAEQRATVRSLCEDFLTPGRMEQRRGENKAAYEQRMQEAKREWPYVFDSPKGRALLNEEWRQHLEYTRPLVYLELLLWPLIGWMYHSWWAALVGGPASLVFMYSLAYVRFRHLLKRTRRDILLRMRVPEEEF